jgi:hypothetical protein
MRCPFDPQAIASVPEPRIRRANENCNHSGGRLNRLVSRAIESLNPIHRLQTVLAPHVVGVSLRFPLQRSAGPRCATIVKGPRQGRGLRCRTFTL